ncbi:MAG TPA: cytochrome c oxidase assembly protein [Nocardioides sp.]|nr:cytochrome c oxidase assembly protein [Nocardioides sp.]
MTFAPLLAAAMAACGGAYALLWRRAGRRTGWPLWRGLVFLVLALGGTIVVTMVDLPGQLWSVAFRLTLLIALLPVAYGLGDPVGLLRAAGFAGVDRVLRTVPVRVLLFPLVSAVLANVWLFVVFFTPLLGHAVRSSATMSLVELGTLVVGLLVALPMLGVDMVPAWCTDPIRLLLAFVDGLIDAIPGIAVMSAPGAFAAGHFAAGSGRVAGQVMLALAEVVALPIFFIIFFRWAGTEIRRDREPDDGDDTPIVPWWIDEN